MRKVLYLLGEPLDIQTLYEQSIYIVLRFKNGEVRKDMTGYTADFVVWLEAPNLPLIHARTGGQSSALITFVSSNNDAILDEMHLFVDFLGGGTVQQCPAPYQYKYRLDVEKNNIDQFVLNGKFNILDYAPDDFEFKNEQPTSIVFQDNVVTIQISEIVPTNNLTIKQVTNNSTLTALIASGYEGFISVLNYVDSDGNSAPALIWRVGGVSKIVPSLDT